MFNDGGANATEVAFIDCTFIRNSGVEGGAIYNEFKTTVPGGKELVDRAMALGK